MSELAFVSRLDYKVKFTAAQFCRNWIIIKDVVKYWLWIGRFFDVMSKTLSVSVFSLSAVDQWFSPGGFNPAGCSSAALPCCAPSLLRCFHLPPDCMSPGAEFHGGGRQHAQSRSNTSKKKRKRKRVRLRGHGCCFVCVFVPCTQMTAHSHPACRSWKLQLLRLLSACTSMSWKNDPDKLDSDSLW